jgi:integrase
MTMIHHLLAQPLPVQHGTRVKSSVRDRRCDRGTYGRSVPSYTWRVATATWRSSTWRSTASCKAAISLRRASATLRPGYALDRASVRQKKTGRPVRFELTEQTRQSVDDYLRSSGREPAQFLFPGRGGPERHLTTRQYARLVARWVSNVGLDPRKFATHSMRRRSKAPCVILALRSTTH